MPRFEPRSIDEAMESRDVPRIQTSRHRKFEERFEPKGRITVIKNLGRRDEEYACKDMPNLVTNAGRDDIHGALYGVPSGGTASVAPYDYIGLTANATDPTTSSTALTAEITSGGLSRAQATTITHTDGSNRTDLSKEFTATAAHTNIHTAGLFSGATGGVMAHAAAFTNTVTLQNNDTLTVEWQITLG